MLLALMLVQGDRLTVQYLARVQEGHLFPIQTMKDRVGHLLDQNQHMCFTNAEFRQQVEVTQASSQESGILHWEVLAWEASRQHQRECLNLPFKNRSVDRPYHAWKERLQC
uniref:Uncharacterized protein n=1 Tax=Dunaliella tertiolecta TaxID=3047 RepID=A0A7S3QQJ5_DUNTE